MMLRKSYEHRYYNITDEEILETRNYNNVYDVECTSNYIADLTERNTNNDGKWRATKRYWPK